VGRAHEQPAPHRRVHPARHLHRRHGGQRRRQELAGERHPAAGARAPELHHSTDPIGPHDSIEGLSAIDKVIAIDQRPIGRTPRSNPGTYTKAFDELREVFANLPDARTRGFTAGRFSFNVKGGRCEACSGDGR
jgi:hypothetical protein